MMFNRPTRPVSKVFIHCTASSNAALVGDKLVREVRRWHLDRQFSDIGYHFLIDFAGQTMAGRPLEVIPSAQQGHNTNSIAICVHGGRPEDFNDHQFAALRDLCGQINRAYQGKVSFHGHCEVAAKTCPIFGYHRVLNLDAAGLMPLADEAKEG